VLAVQAASRPRILLLWWVDWSLNTDEEDDGLEGTEAEGSY
jgi:hypothetical protein